MQQQKRPHQGKVLESLIVRSQYNKKEAAQLLGFHPAYLSTQYKEGEISEELKERAAKLFQVDVSIFETDLPNLPPPTVAAEPPPPEYGSGQMAAAETRLLSEIARLKEENRQLLLRLAEKEGYIASKQATIEDLLALLRERKE